MAQAKDEYLDSERRPAPDGISCVGILLLAAMLIFTLGVAMSNSGNSNRASLQATLPRPGQTATALLSLPALTFVTATNTATQTPTSTATVTTLPTDTATATSTATIPPTAGSSPVAIPTEAPTLPPTLTPTPLPLPTPNGIYSQTVRVPILMYHYVSIPPEGADKYRVDLSVSPDNFRAQMEYLAANGYTTIDLYDLSRAITDKQELPPRPVIITVDDGYRDFYDNAFPVLRELGLTATLFIITDFVDQNHPVYLTWPMIGELAAAGMRIEPHSKNHVNMDGRDRDFLVWEMLGSQETVEAHIGYKPRYFAYPGGRYDDLAMQVLDELGFWGSVTTQGGTWHGFTDRFEWTRMRVRYTTTMEDFIDILN